MNTYLLTGASGFIGKNLVSVLEGQKDKVEVISRQDLGNEGKIMDIMKKVKPDYIIHMAAYGNHSNQEDDLKKTIGVNIIKTVYMLEASKNIDFKAFVNFSTSSVYLPYQTFYSATKLSAECICKAYAQKYKKPIISVRPASVFGEGEAEFRLIPTIINTLRQDYFMKLDPTPKHSWIYIKDFINALLLIIKKIKEIEGGEAINISYGKQWSNREIVKKLERISTKKLIYEKVERMRAYDTDNWLVKNDRLSSLGYQAEYGIDKGLINTYVYYGK